MLISLDPRGIDLAYPTEFEGRSGQEVCKMYRYDITWVSRSPPPSVRTHVRT